MCVPRLRGLLFGNLGDTTEWVLAEARADPEARIELQHDLSLRSMRAQLDLTDGSFDVVVLALEPPKENLDTAVRRVREVFSATPCVVVLENDAMEWSAQLFAEGVEDCLVKDQVCGFLIPAICHAVDRSRARRQPDELGTARSILEDSRDPTFVLDSHNRVQYANPAAKTLFSNRLVEGREFGLPLIEDSVQELKVPQVNGGYVTVEMSVVDTRWCGESARLLTLRDVTERNAARETLEHVNEVLRAIRDINELIVREADPATLLARACRILASSRAYSGAWVLTKTLHAQSGWSDGEFAELIASRGESRWPVCRELAMVTEDHSVVLDPSVLCSGCPLGPHHRGAKVVVTELRHRESSVGILGVRLPDGVEVSDDEVALLTDVAADLAFGLHDIESERARTASERLLSFAIDQMPVPVIVAEPPDVKITRFNQLVVEMLAKPSSDVTQIALQAHREYWPTFYPDGTPFAIEDLPLTRAIKEGVTTTGQEIIVRQGDRDRWISASAAPLRDEDGEIVAATVVFPEITNLKQYQQQMLAERDRAQQYLDVAAVMLLGLDREGTITLVNRKGCEILGVEDQSVLVGSDWFRFVHPEDRELKQHVFAEIMAGNIEAFREAEARVVTSRGETRRVVWHNAVIRDESGAIVGALSSGDDVTEQREAEAALRTSEQMLRQAQRMESVGRLAGGIAHDFNNILMVINTRANLLLSRLDEGDLRSGVEQILDAGERAANLTRQLLAFSRKQKLEPQVLDLNAAIRDLDRMLRRLIGEDIDLRVAVDDTPCRVNVDPGQLEQVVMNLAVNARDAMPTGGTLTIETFQVGPDSTLVAQAPSLRTGSFAVLTVRDDGVGMDAQTMSHVFEPFFTTKEEGRGTGLGLATVYGIVTQSGGEIQVESTPGQGTTFRVFLPVSDDALMEQESAHQSTALEGNETILVVEDEETVRELVVEILTAAGYAALEAAGAEDALELARSPGVAVDLLLTDVVMPKTSGRELADQLVQLAPGTKVLFMSGYTDDTVVRHGAEDNGPGFLPKPFSVDELLHAVRSILDDR